MGKKFSTSEIDEKEDRFRFTYEIGGYILPRRNKWDGIRVVRYGPSEDSWTQDMMEAEAEKAASEKDDPFSIYDLHSYEGKPATDSANFSGPEEELSSFRILIGFAIFSVSLIFAVISFFTGSELWWMLLIFAFGFGAALASRYTRLFDWMDM